MIKIEKTQLNMSAFIILSSTLKKTASPTVVEIINNGTTILQRQKEKGEIVPLDIDFNLLDEMFLSYMRNPSPLVLSGHYEDFFRNASFACYYYRQEHEIAGPFDHFQLFHDIHFTRLSDIKILEKDIFENFLRLFRIPTDIVSSFITLTTCQEIKTRVLSDAFNDIFDVLVTDVSNEFAKISFQSKTLNINTSLDALFAIKDLLFARNIRVEQIPESDFFGLQQKEVVNYTFFLGERYTVNVTFSYEKLEVSFSQSQLHI